MKHFLKFLFSSYAILLLRILLSKKCELKLTNISLTFFSNVLYLNIFKLLKYYFVFALL